jgi:hypothetical protein
MQFSQKSKVKPGFLLRKTAVLAKISSQKQEAKVFSK